MEPIPNGPVARQLLEYIYRDARHERLVKGELEAVTVSRQWIEAIFAEAFWPVHSFHPFLHRSDSTSCDAIAVAYRTRRNSEHLEISVFQTIHVVVVTAVPQARLGAPSNASPIAPELARTLFNDAHRLNLTVTSQDTAGTCGRQISPGVEYEDYDWLDTIRWWDNAGMSGFEMLKRTGPEQRIVVRPSLEANRTWFAMFDQPRSI